MRPFEYKGVNYLSYLGTPSIELFLKYLKDYETKLEDSDNKEYILETGMFKIKDGMYLERNKSLSIQCIEVEIEEKEIILTIEVDGSGLNSHDITVVIPFDKSLKNISEESIDRLIDIWINSKLNISLEKYLKQQLK